MSNKEVKGGLYKDFSLLIIFLTYTNLYDPISAEDKTAGSKFTRIICTHLPNSKHPPGGIRAPSCSSQRPGTLTYIIHIFYSRTKMITLFIDKGGYFGIATLIN
jgi:hypothetical protein